MTISHLGKEWRKPRIDADHRLSDMAKQIGVSPAFLFCYVAW